MKPLATKPLQLRADSWREIRNAIVRDNREMPFLQLSHAIRVREPVLDAVIALPDEILAALDAHHRRGSLEKVLRETLADLSQPTPNNQISIDCCRFTLQSGTLAFWARKLHSN